MFKFTISSDDSNELEDNALIDFDIGYLIRDVEGYHKGNLVMERARDLLSRSDFNFKDKIKSRMKGKLNFQDIITLPIFTSVQSIIQEVYDINIKH